MYRQVAPAEEVSYDEASSERGKADAPEAGNGKAPSGNGKASKGKGNKPAAKEGKGDGKATGKADDEADKGLVDVLGDTVKDVVPDPIEDAVEFLPDELTPFRTFMADISQPGTAPVFEVQEIDTDGEKGADALYIEATAQVSDSVSVTAQVVTPIEEAPDAHPCVVAITLTDPVTSEVLAAPEPVVVDDPQAVSQAAIGAVVDTVIETVASDSSSAENDAAADEVTDSAEEILETLPGSEAAQRAEEEFALAR